MATTSKSFLLSKTFWFNIITALLAVVSEISQVFPISKHPTLYVSINTVGNILLRLLTNTAITGIGVADNTTPPKQ